MAEEDDNVENEIGGLGCAHENFQEHKEVNELIERLPNVCSNAIGSEACYERFIYILSLYQEQPQLLYPYLDELLSKLLIYSKEDTFKELRHLAFKLIYIITKTVGYKSIIKYFPHEVSDLELILTLLSQQNPKDFTSWETRYVLLLWLSIVVMIPFHMERLDGGLEMDGHKRKPIIVRILEVIKQYLGVGDKTRDAAAFLASRFLTRPDMKEVYLPEFLDWAIKTLKQVDPNTSAGENLHLGILLMLALLFKHGKREDMKQYGETILKNVLECDFCNSKNALVQKLMLKLIQRIGLSFMPTKLASWRYNRGCRLLTLNLNAPYKTENANVVNHVAGDTLEVEEDYDISEEIEDIIEQLLAGLSAKQTIVRWSAAKGIGRITSRLPWELAEDVMSSILELFCLRESHSAWHGGCLALAELGRRGLIIPSLLDKVIPVILKALVYDELLGNYSVGAHIRDAACYVCWSFARAFEPLVLKPYALNIARALAVTSVFDREVNCRKAASAAFQENVGRQGTIPHGIDILHAAAYHTVGSRTNAFLSISVYIAQFEEYTQSLIDHLLEYKINHWDTAIRVLSSKALRNLTSKAPEYMSSYALPKLLTLATVSDLNTKHGAILAISEIIHALFKIAMEQSKNLKDMGVEENLQDIRNIVFILKEKHQFQSLGGILMRQAFCHLIEKASLSALPFHSDKELIVHWKNVIDSSLSQIEEDVRKAAISAFPHFCNQYYTNEEEAVSFLDNYLQQLHTGQQEARCGHISAIGSLPKHILSGRVHKVIENIIKCIRLPKEEEMLVELKSDAVKAMYNVCQSIGIDSQSTSDAIFKKEHLESIFECLLEALNDYTVDSRGDIGTVVREAAMISIQGITQLIVNKDSSYLSPEFVSRIMCNVLQQCVEKIDRIRNVAGNTFSSLLHSVPEVPYIPHRMELEKVFPLSLCKEINWAAPSDTFPYFVQLLSCETYTYNLLLGLTVSVGGLTESLVKYSRSSLLNYLGTIESDSTKLKYICDTLLRILSENLQNDRIIVSYFRMMDHLLTSELLVSEENDNIPFLTTLLNLCWKACSKSTNPQKIIASIDVYCNLLQFTNTCSSVTLNYLVIFLCHRFPRIRKVTASKLYEALISYPNVVSDASLDDAMTILSETNWDLPANMLRPIRNQFCELCGISPPKVVKKTAD